MCAASGPVLAGNDKRCEVARLDEGGQFSGVVDPEGRARASQLSLACAESVVGGLVHQAGELSLVGKLDLHEPACAFRVFIDLGRLVLDGGVGGHDLAGDGA